MDCRTGKPKDKPIDVYFPEEQLDLLDRFIVRKAVFDFYQQKGLMKLHTLNNGEKIKFGDIEIEAVQFPTSTAFYYLIKQNDKKVICMPCEIKEIKELKKLENTDYLIIHFKICL